MEGKKKSSISYTIYQYRQELSRSKKRYTDLYGTKITLTDELLKKSVKNLRQCSTEDLRAVTRELQFKKKLEAALRLQRKGEKVAKTHKTEKQ